MGIEHALIETVDGASPRASSMGIEHALIETVDGDVLVLSIHYFKQLGLSTLLLWFAMGKRVKFIAVHEIANSFPPKYALGRPFFHAFTGCDTTSGFENYGKKSAMKLQAE